MNDLKCKRSLRVFIFDAPVVSKHLFYMVNYRLVFIAMLTLVCNRISGQSFADLKGQWVNVNDSSEHLTLGTNGEFRLITHDVFNNEYNRYIGHWMYNTRVKKKLFLFPEHLPRRYYVVKRRGILGYSLNERKGHMVYARRALLTGEVLPRVGLPKDVHEARLEY